MPGKSRKAAATAIDGNFNSLMRLTMAGMPPFGKNAVSIRYATRTIGMREGLVKIPRRAFLRLTAGASLFPFARSSFAAQSAKAPAASPGEPALAHRLAEYALGLRYQDLDPATIERV
jgi:hypothetical protein